MRYRRADDETYRWAAWRSVRPIQIRGSGQGEICILTLHITRYQVLIGFLGSWRDILPSGLWVEEGPGALSVGILMTLRYTTYLHYMYCMRRHFREPHCACYHPHNLLRMKQSQYRGGRGQKSS
jgi:hypothetical protein